MSKILIIEDDHLVSNLIYELLIIKDYEVIKSYNGKDGVILALSEKPDLIICDVDMPEMDGHEVLKYIRENRLVSNTPFIFLTAQIKHSDIRKGMFLGADDYLTKPFSSQDLYDSINSRLLRKEKITIEINEKINQVIRNMNQISTHELVTPLTGITSSIELIQDYLNELSKDDLQNMLDIISNSSKRLNKLVNKITFCNKLINIENEEMNKSLYSNGSSKECKHLIINKALFVSEKYDRFEDLDLDIGDSTLGIAPENLEIILEELIDNAFKFSEKGQKVNLKGVKKQKEYFLSITDNGIGFKFDHFSKIGPYIQFERDINEQQGMGIGLFIAKKLLLLNNSILGFDSNVEIGTKINFVLPLYNTSLLENNF